MHFYPDKLRAHNPLYYLIMASTMLCTAVFLMPLTAKAQVADERFSVQRAAVIDLARIIRESEATERVRALLDTKSEEFQKEFAEKEVQLLAAKEFKARQGLISEEAYQEEVRAFQREVAVQQIFKIKDNLLDRALQQAQDKIRQLATTIVAEQASELNIDLVFKEEQLNFPQSVEYHR